ncbi:hypothetical protein F5Y16DRAFT_260938 [Xylariaceae sp. FL0255]|nr:hypothetical protein F5Y16DRAFT_260938 [Xylariaceae sp. FL0255]
MKSDTFEIFTPGIELISQDRIDTRSDEELIACLRSPIPVRHEKNVWAFWNDGWDSMRPWTQRNVLGWMRRQGPDWDVRVLDMVPGSATNVQNFIPSPSEYLPECSRAGTMDGLARGQHASHMARLPLLYFHGGVWLDVGSLLFRTFDDISWREISDPNSPFEMGISLFQSRMYPGQCLTGFIVAKKGNPFIERWMRVWLQLWNEYDGKKRTNCLGIHEHPLLKPLGLIVPPDLREDPNPRKLDMGGSGASFDLEILTDYLAFNMAYERVRLLVDESTGWNGPAYFRKHVHLIDTVDELWKSHEMLLQDEVFPLLSLPFKPKIISEDMQQKAATDYVGYVLANCAIAKHSQGHWQPGTRIPLAMSWGMAGNEEADIKPGTWAEYMRWASIYCEQTRYKGTCLPSLSLAPEKDSIIRAGLLETEQV